MYQTDSKGISYSAGFFLLIGFGLAGLMFAGVVGIPIWTSMTGRSILDMKTEMSNPAYANAIKLIQIISVVLGLFVPAFLVALLMNRKPFKLLGYKKNIKPKQLGLVLLLMITALFISGALAYFNQKIPIPVSWKQSFREMEENYAKQVEVMTGLKNFGDYLLSIFILALLPAFCEETMFRGGLQNFLTRSIKIPWLSIVLISILFSAVHFSYYGFLSRMFLGIMLGLIFYFTSNIWLCIVAHFFNNALAITQLYIYTQQGKNIKQAMNEDIPFYWGIFTLPLLIYFLFLLKKSSLEIPHTGSISNQT